MSGSRLHPFVVTNRPHTSAPLDRSAAIQLADTNKGFLPNRLTTAQRDAITNPANGLLIFNTTLSAYQFYNGIDWTSISNGMVKLASGTITTPVAYLDLALPENYSRIVLEYNRVKFSTEDAPAFALSFDNGITWLADTTNFDSYFWQATKYRANLNGGDVVDSSGIDTLSAGIYGYQGEADSALAYGRIEFDPGNSTTLASFHWVQWSFDTHGAPAYIRGGHTFGWVNPLATVTPIPTRANKLRFLPYGVDDADPPSSGTTITSGSYTVWGIAP